MNILAATEALDIPGIAMGLLGGLALFLYGMHKLSDGLRTVAGDGMKTLLARLTTNRFTGAITGALVTAVLQSSSITTVLVVGFVSAGLMTLAQSVGIIMGANVGTTITAQILAFNITDYAWLMIAVGFVGWSFARRDYVRNFGAMLIGLGMLFVGMGQMGDATNPLRSYQPFIDAMQQMDNRVLALLIGAAFTALVQSSSATIGIVIMLASEGYLSLEAGISLGIGSKIGTCVTALLSGIGRPTEARRVGVVHVLFNVLGALLWLPFIGQLAAMSRGISPAYADLSGVAQLAAETPRQVANAITLFALVNLLVMIWFIYPIMRLAQWLVPDRQVTEPARMCPKYLDNALIQTPALAIDRIRLELGHLGERLVSIVDEAPPMVIHGTRDDLDRIEQMDDVVDELYADIIEYITLFGREELKSSESKNLEDYLEIAHNLESIGDLIETNLVAQGRQRIQQGLVFEGHEGDEVKDLYDAVEKALRDTLDSLAGSDIALARDVIERKQALKDLASVAKERAATSVIAGDTDQIKRFRIESDIIDQIHRLYFHVRRIAKIVAAAERA